MVDVLPLLLHRSSQILCCLDRVSSKGGCFAAEAAWVWHMLCHHVLVEGGDIFLSWMLLPPCFGFSIGNHYLDGFPLLFLVVVITLLVVCIVHYDGSLVAMSCNSTPLNETHVRHVGKACS